MRIGLLGPADGEEGVLREAAEFLVGDALVDQAIYLGIDDAIDRMVRSWSQEIVGSEQDDSGFLRRAAELATRGTPEQIGELLDADALLRRLSSIRKLPPAPARAVEMIEDRIVLVVHDKATLDAEDIANATVIVYGKSDEVLLKRFGPRYFFSPGPLRDRKVGILELESDGRIAVGLFEPSGAPLWRQTLQTRGAKLTVSD